MSWGLFIFNAAQYVAIVVGIIWFIRRRRRAKVMANMPPEQRAMTEIDRIKSETMRAIDKAVDDGR